MENLEFEKHLKKAITAEERKHQKEYLQSLEANFKNKKLKKKFNWRIAASLLVLVGLGSYFLLFNQSISNEKLYETYFYPYENVVAPIVRDNLDLDKKAQIFSQYEQGDFEKAIKGFNQLTSKDSIDITTVNFYKANAYLQLKEFTEAETLFNKIIKEDNTEWKEESIWYLALISIKQNNKETAIQYLQKLQKENKKSFKDKEVEDLLNLLY